MQETWSRADPDWPAPLLNNDPAGFAWGVWHQRTPQLIARIKDAHPYPPKVRAALDRLLEEVTAGTIAPLPARAWDDQAWSAWGAPYFGTPWLDAPFLWSESYFYRQVLEATGYFDAGPWQRVDPFIGMKSAELADPSLAADLRTLSNLSQLPDADQDTAVLLAALHGNRADLGFLIQSPEARTADSAGLVADDTARLRTLLTSSPRIVLAADNAGRELIADLVLIDHVLARPAATEVSLHLKPWPYYVSDATTTDLLACLDRLTGAGGTAAAVATRIRTAMTTGQVRIFTHDFYCAPLSYRSMPADLAAEFERASLTIFKGDLHYRRLVGDLAWPVDTPFARVTSYFPGAVAALRVLKSDVLTGLTSAITSRLDYVSTSWRTDGTRSLIQLAS